MKIKRLLNISRPRFWIYEIGPYIIGIAAATGLVAYPWYSIPVLVFFIFFTYPANIYIYGINDVYDYDTDKLNPKKVSYESLVMPDEQKGLLKHIMLVSLPFALYAVFLISTGVMNTVSGIAFLAFLFFAGFYSAKPIRAKARPIFDSIFSAGHYVATAVFSYLLVSSLLNQQINWALTGIATIAGLFWAISMHAYSAVPDIKADGDAGLQTIATKLGKKGTIAVCAALYAIAGILSYLWLKEIGIALTLVYLYIMYTSFNADDERLFTIYKKFPVVNTIAGMIIFFAVLLS